MVAPRTQNKDAGLDFNLDLGSAAPEAKPALRQPHRRPQTTPGWISISTSTSATRSPSRKRPRRATSRPSAWTSADPRTPRRCRRRGTDPKWQEIATKLDLAKAYEEMGDKDGARELLNEVMKDGDAAQKGQAQQLLAKLG